MKTYHPMNANIETGTYVFYAGIKKPDKA